MVREFKAKEAVKYKNAYWDKANDYPVVFEDLEQIYARIKQLANKGEESIILSESYLPNYFYHDQYENHLIESGEQNKLNRMIQRRKILLEILAGNGYTLTTLPYNGATLFEKLVIKW